MCIWPGLSFSFPSEAQKLVRQISMCSESLDLWRSPEENPCFMEAVCEGLALVYPSQLKATKPPLGLGHS